MHWYNNKRLFIVPNLMWILYINLARKEIVKKTNYEIFCISLIAFRLSIITFWYLHRSKDGERVFDVTVPDSITTWYASGFGMSHSAGIGIANAAEVRAFQPFFISLNLPYSVVRDEDVTVSAAIFSYLPDKCITVSNTGKYRWFRKYYPFLIRKN